MPPKPSRCWAGYEPVPGKSAFSKGSCKKIAVKPVVKTVAVSVSSVVKDLDKFLGSTGSSSHIKIRDYLKKNEKLLNSSEWKNNKSVPDYFKFIGMFANHTDEKAKHIIPSIRAAKNLFANHKITMK